MFDIQNPSYSTLALYSFSGLIYKSKDDSTSECIRIICTNTEITPTWKRVDSHEPIQSCIKGKYCFDINWIPAEFLNKGIYIRTQHHKTVPFYNKGCISDCQCPPGEFCKDGSCTPLYCDLQEQLGFRAQRVPQLNGQNPTITINSTAVLSCAMPGQIFQVEGGNTGSKIMVSFSYFQKSLYAICSIE